MDGIILIDKPAGPTSHDVVAGLRKALKLRRAGHAGTLDPQATGLLVLALGEATKWLDWLPKDKRYRATVRFGLESDTEDIWGKETARKGTQGLDEKSVRAVLEGLKYKEAQVPPMVSALKHLGKPLYAWARQGVEIERKARPLKIHEIKFLAWRQEQAEADFEVHCEGGTYVRSLCSEAGRELGCGAVMSALRRLSVGHFKVEDALPLSRISEAETRLKSAASALAHLSERRLSEAEAQAVLHGRDIEASQSGEGAWRLTGSDGRLLALASSIESKGAWKLHPQRVFSR